MLFEKDRKHKILIIHSLSLQEDLATFLYITVNWFLIQNCLVVLNTVSL